MKENNKENQVKQEFYTEEELMKCIDRIEKIVDRHGEMIKELMEKIQNK